jgi:Ca2+-binding RTX toxin-like protein
VEGLRLTIENNRNVMMQELQSFTGVNKIVVNGGAGNDTIDLSGIKGDVKAEIHGGDGVDTITGGGADDTIFGDAGNDIITGGGGVDATQWMEKVPDDGAAPEATRSGSGAGGLFGI